MPVHITTAIRRSGNLFWPCGSAERVRDGGVKGFLGDMACASGPLVSDTELTQGVDHPHDQAGESGMRDLEVTFRRTETFDQRIS